MVSDQYKKRQKHLSKFEGKNVIVTTTHKMTLNGKTSTYSVDRPGKIKEHPIAKRRGEKALVFYEKGKKNHTPFDKYTKLKKIRTTPGNKKGTRARKLNR